MMIKHLIVKLAFHGTSRENWDSNDLSKDEWIAVAKRAREMRAEK